MKKALRLTSLLLVFVALLGLTSCVPSADKAAEKMEKAGYVSLDTSKIGLTLEESKVEKAMLFVKGDNAVEALANLVAGDTVVAVYFKEKADAKEFFNKIKEENKDSTVKQSGKCVYYGTEQGVKDFN